MTMKQTHLILLVLLLLPWWGQAQPCDNLELPELIVAASTTQTIDEALLIQAANVQVAQNAELTMSAEEGILLREVSLLEIGSQVLLSIQPCTVNDEEVLLQEDLASFQILPNPINDFLEGSYELAETSEVQWRLTDLGGIEVYAQPTLKNQMPGTYAIRADLSHLPAGIYFLQLRINQDVATHKPIKL